MTPDPAPLPVPAFLRRLASLLSTLAIVLRRFGSFRFDSSRFVDDMLARNPLELNACILTHLVDPLIFDQQKSSAQKNKDSIWNRFTQSGLLSSHKFPRQLGSKSSSQLVDSLKVEKKISAISRLEFCRRLKLFIAGKQFSRDLSALPTSSNDSMFGISSSALKNHFIIASAD